MAHNLATTNGKTAMFYTGEEAPWHRLGTRLDEPATAREAIVAAGLDYEVELTSLETTDCKPVPQRKAVVRSDTEEVIGVVGNSYVPVQNREAFGYLDAVVADGGLRYHTAGALGKGERIWLLAKLPGHIRIKGGDDVVEKFLLLSNSHNASSALKVFFTPIRVVCQNTLSMAESTGRGQGVSILHKGNLTAKIQEAQRVLGLAERFYADAAERINFLANHYPASEQLRHYFKTLYPDPDSASNTRAKNIREKLTSLFDTGIGMDIPEIRHSSWAALNAVTEWVDHNRNSTTRLSRRVESAWFGSGAKLKARAWELALGMAS